MGLRLLAASPILSRHSRFAKGSPWEQGMVEQPIGSAPNLGAVCRAHQDDWYDRIVPVFDPDIVVLSHRTLDDALTPSLVSFPHGRRLRSSDRAFAPWRRRRSRARSTGSAQAAARS